MPIRWREGRWDYQGTVAVVTGASSGIGQAIAVALARRGATVAGVARREAELAATIQECRRHAPASIERRLASVTVPRRFGIPPILYPMPGGPMRWGLRRYDQRAARRPVEGSR